MLGKLAKRLRLLGFDVLYDRTILNNEIIRLSLEQDRVILTRDTGLAARPIAVNQLLIKSELVQEQIRQVLATVPLETRLNPLTRCSLCNDPLDHITKQETQDLVPQHVYENNNVFLRCPRCKRTYWHGTHVRRMAKDRHK